MLIAAIKGMGIPSGWHVAHSTPMMYGWYQGYGHPLHPSIWCLSCLTGIMVPFILWHGMLHTPDEAPIQVLHTLSAWCTPRYQVCRHTLYGMP